MNKQVLIALMGSAQATHEDYSYSYSSAYSYSDYYSSGYSYGSSYSSGYSYSPSYYYSSYSPYYYSSSYSYSGYSYNSTGTDYDYDDPSLGYMYAPEDWGMTADWNENMFCGGVVDPEYEAIDDQFPDDEPDSWNGLSTREECYQWCKETKRELGYGTCCGNAYYGDSEKGIFKRYCALYDSPEGVFEYWEEEVGSTWGLFYSARTVEDEGKGEEGIMEQAAMWFEDTFGSSSAKEMAAFVSLSAAAVTLYTV